MIPNKVPVQNEKMVRDMKSKAILSTDRDAILAYEKKKLESKAQKERINRLEQELADLKTLISELVQKR
jgi:hypothetical protein